MPIRQYIEDEAAFEQTDNTAMSLALEDVCKVFSSTAAVRGRS